MLTSQIAETYNNRALQSLFHDTYILMSLKKYMNEDYIGAIKDIKLALDYPIGNWGRERRAQMNYYLGTFFEKTGDYLKAVNSYQKTIEEIVEGTEYHYEKGLAYKKFGKHIKATEQFKSLIKLAERKDMRSGAYYFFKENSGNSIWQAQRYYIKGLAFHGMGRVNEALTQFKHALVHDSSHIWAKYMFNLLYLCN